MKTRIISGIIMGAIVAAVLVLGFLISSVFITLAVGLLAAGAVYELLHNAVGIKDKATVIGAAVFAVLCVFTGEFGIQWISGLFTVCVLYCIYAVVMILKNHKDFDLSKICAVYGLPIAFSIAFFCLNRIIIAGNGIYYLLLLLNFSSVCDMGAYFVGVTCGKHKLCPNISPKKTVEGAIGGIVSSIVFSVIISLIFGKFSVILLLMTIPFCILGMIGDLFASAIKRSVDLKDYGNLIPGHGGIMDRLDSIIMIAPLMFISIGFNLI
ncbi:MAG: phosphatidate cytidylyltransferase [Clostridia bacterium]|nr:phosphatidate cytidylyltransferase [Clostridia bacterium]